MFIRHSACAEARCCHDARIAVEDLLCLYVYIT